MGSPVVGEITFVLSMSAVIVAVRALVQGGISSTTGHRVCQAQLAQENHLNVEKQAQPPNNNNILPRQGSHFELIKTRTLTLDLDAHQRREYCSKADGLSVMRTLVSKIL